MHGPHASLACAALAALAAACREPAPPLSAVVVTLDTTRADALGCYGQRLPLTPALDRLAGMGTLFERASTCAPLTLPAHAALWSGLYPPRSGVRVNGTPLPAAATTLAERARAAGFQTAAFLGSAVLDPAFGLEQGFERYDAPDLAEGEGRGERPGVRVVERALAWLRARDPRRPFLLWVHVFDPHDPYEPPARFAPPEGVHPYYGEIAAADAAVGALCAWLDDAGLLARTVVVVAGDHGEALGQHGEATHGDYCWEPTLHVPLVVCGPDVPRGERSRALASLVDVAPTLAARLGLAWPDGGDGRDLLAPAPPGRGVYFECYTGWLSYGWSPLAGWRDEGGKYLASARPSFVRPEQDPAEERDLLAEGAIDPAPYRAAIAAVHAAPALAREDDALDPELAARLGAMGYALAPPAHAAGEALPSPLAPSDRPAPSERTDEHARALQAHAWIAAERFAEAEAAFARIVAENPRHLAAWDRLAWARFRQGDAAGALAALDALLAARPDQPSALVARAGALVELGRDGEALAALERAAALAPRSPATLEPLARALERAGRADEAARVRALLAERRR